MRERSRRSFLQSSSLLLAGGVLSGSAAARERQSVDRATPGRTVVDGAASGGADVSVRATEYYGGNRDGAILEDFRSRGTTVATDLHTMLWNAKRRSIRNGRDDAVRGNLIGADPDVPEERLQNDLPFPSERTPALKYTATLGQRVVAGYDHAAILVETDLSFRQGYTDYDLDDPHTVYTVVNPEVGGQQNEAWTTSRSGYDLVVATDADREEYVALAQRRPETGQTSFDGARVGLEGRSAGTDESAWHDVYEEADGWITPNDYAAGDVDAGVGLYLGRARRATWLTAVGTGRTEDDAATDAVAVLEAGFEGVREKYT